MQSAKDILLLANSAEDQKVWVKRLQQKVAKTGYVQAAATAGAGDSSGRSTQPG